MKRAAFCLLLAILALPALANAACPPGYYEYMGYCYPYPPAGGGATPYYRPQYNQQQYQRQYNQPQYTQPQNNQPAYNTPQNNQPAPSGDQQRYHRAYRPRSSGQAESTAPAPAPPPPPHAGTWGSGPPPVTTTAPPPAAPLQPPPVTSMTPPPAPQYAAPAPPAPVGQPAPPPAPVTAAPAPSSRAARGGGQRVRPPAAADGRSGAPIRILDTGYAVLPRSGGEAPGYGLYSYAILPLQSPRSGRFLAEMFRSTPAVEGLQIGRDQLNVLYVPIQSGKLTQFQQHRERQGDNADKLGSDFASTFYDYATARAILAHICGYPPDDMREFCLTDVMSGGPYLFSYARPASSQEQVPPPYLLVDLTGVDPRAYGVLLSAFREQVKRDDMTDKARVGTLKQHVLNVILVASDLIDPMQRAVEDLIKGMVHTAEAHDAPASGSGPR